VLVTDITERIKKDEEINIMSQHDLLTGLYTRRFYEEELKRLDTERYYPFTIVMGDVNALKIVNDAFGHTAARMHNIGNIAINENIFSGAEVLRKREWRDVKKHPEIGYRILSSVMEFSEIAKYVLEHHERWDGTGYPKGLKGEEIPLSARIINVVDSYDAMTSKRIYGKELSKEEAITEMRSCSGSQFDPELIKIFIEEVLTEL